MLDESSQIPPTSPRIAPEHHFAWLKAQFGDVLVVFSAGKYLEHCDIRWESHCFRPSKAQQLLLQLTQADGWQIEQVRWVWFDEDIGMKAVTLVRHAHDRD